MTTQRFPLKGEFIELNVLLKLLALAPSGGSAKSLIASGAVRVDGVTETRIRRKLREGSRVEVGGQKVLICANGDSAT